MPRVSTTNVSEQVIHSLRISKSNRLIRSYMHSRSRSRDQVFQILEREVAEMLYYLETTVSPDNVTRMREMAERLFRQGFLAGCRTGLNKSTFHGR